MRPAKYDLMDLTGWCGSRTSCFNYERNSFSTLRPRQNGRHFADDTFKRIFLNENVIIFIKISLKFVPKGRINIILALVQIMAWRRPGDKPLSEPMMVSLLTYICVTRPQWVKELDKRPEVNDNPGHFTPCPKFVLKKINCNDSYSLYIYLSVLTYDM